MRLIAFVCVLTITVNSVAQYEVAILPNLGGHMRAEAMWNGTIAGHTNEAPEVPVAWIEPGSKLLRLSADKGLALATSGDTLGGYLRIGTNYNTYRAVMWRLGQARPVQTVLHPTNGFYGNSWVFGTDGQSQVGRGSFFEPGWTVAAYHALLWRGSAESVTNLHPMEHNFRTSIALDVEGDFQVGSVTTYSPYIGGEVLATMWRGSAETMVMLHPAGAYYSQAVAHSGDTIAGYVDYGEPRPVVWKIGIPGYQQLPITGHRGWLRDTNGNEHVGYVATLLGGHGGGIEYRATVWAGDPPVATNLHSLLPAEIVQSFAEGIDAEGNIVGHGDTGGERVAILWRRINR